jgi:hypothetical protein
MISQRTALPMALMVSLAAVSACKRSAAPATQESPSGSADALGPDAKPGVSAGAARLVLPVVPGRPGVAYFRVTNNTGAPITLASVHVQGAGKAEMHRTSGGQMAPVDHVDIAPGAVTTFAPGGLHVMAFDIKPDLAPSQQGELTLTFADGDKLSLPMKVEAMGADDGMPGMSH